MDLKERAELVRDYRFELKQGREYNYFDNDEAVRRRNRRRRNGRPLPPQAFDSPRQFSDRDRGSPQRIRRSLNEAYVARVAENAPRGGINRNRRALRNISEEFGLHPIAQRQANRMAQEAPRQRPRRRRQRTGPVSFEMSTPRQVQDLTGDGMTITSRDPNNPRRANRAVMRPLRSPRMTSRALNAEERANIANTDAINRRLGLPPSRYSTRVYTIPRHNAAERARLDRYLTETGRRRRRPGED